MPKKKSEIRGCIDVGSTYFRLLVAERISRSAAAYGGKRDAGDPHAGIRVLMEEKAYVGWGEALSRDGLLLESELACAARALEFLVSRAAEEGCLDPVIVGTNTLRMARNRREALGRFPRPVAVLSQRGEAALGFLGASSVIAHDGSAVQIDVGGTSTEIAWGRAGIMRGFLGLPWGTHAARAATEGLGLHGALTVLRGLVFSGPGRPADGALSPLPGIGTTDTILCTGGTAVSLAVILNHARRIRPLFGERERISTGELELVLRRSWGLFERGRRHRLPLERERVSLLLPGMVLLTLLVREMRLDGFTVTSRDIRWGGIIAGDDLTEYSIDGRSDR